jgi:drug/metabolite transporter (DMT)-like permease
MKAATLDRSMDQTPATSVAAMADPTPTTTSVSKTAVLVGLCFLAATFTFAIGNALIRSYFSSATAHSALIAGVFLLVCCALAVAANGAAMRRILTPHTPIRSQAYFVLRMTECLTLVAVGVYFLTSHTEWDAYVLAVYAVSGAAGLVLSSALLTSGIVPRNLSVLGLIGYPVFLMGSMLAMFKLISVTHGVGMLALVPGGLFELILPIWLFTKGFTSHQIES